MEDLTKEYKRHLCGFNEQFEDDVKEALLQEFKEMVDFIYDRMFDGSAHGLYLEDQFTREEFLTELLALRSEGQEDAWFNNNKGG